jgi:formylglycine-generating enzyme required for sulfatase activity
MNHYPDQNSDQQAEPVSSAGPHSGVCNILPPPFEWVEIPRGRTTLIDHLDVSALMYLQQGVPTTFKVNAFFIAKYPVTNAQFAAFIEAGGYTTERWWTAQGWRQRQSQQWIAPYRYFWQDASFNGPDNPIIGISWYEVVAFINWLREASGEAVTLPSEQEWQWAAQGSDGRRFPWGNTWESDRCNNSVYNVQTREERWSQWTTPVQQFEGKGDSAFGVVDMVGNTWERCRTEWFTGHEVIDDDGPRVMRGGDFGGRQLRAFFCTTRGKAFAISRDSAIGFRLARPAQLRPQRSFWPFIFAAR